VFIGLLRKILKHTVIQKYFFLEILINVKAGRVNLSTTKIYHGRMAPMGALMDRPDLKQTISKMMSLE
jgi:hypothetical protein